MCHVNLASDEAFKEHTDLLETHQQRQYQDAFSDFKKMGNNISRFQERYYDNARFIIYAQLPFSSKFARCGMSVNGRPGYCRKRFFCTCCSYKAGTNMVDRFRNEFYGRTWYFVTFGFKGALPWAKRDQSDVYWEAADYALGKVLNRRADGAILSRELHIRSMMPLTLNPHTHAVLSFALFPEAFDLQQQLQDGMEEYLAQALPGQRDLVSDVKLDLIEDIDGYEGCMRYMFKPIDLKGEYESAQILHGSSPEIIMRLNSEMRDLLSWFTVSALMKKMVRYKGVCSGGTNGIGLSVRALRNQRRNRWEGRRARSRCQTPIIPSKATGEFSDRSANSVLQPL